MGAYLILNTAITAKNHNYLWCRDYRDIRHLAIYRDNLQYRAIIYIHFIFIANKCIGLHFPTNDIGLSSLKFFWRAPKFLFISGRSRASKVIDVGANQKRICDFLSVSNSNLGPILHRFGVMTAFMCSWPHPYSILILGCSRCTRSPILGVNESIGFKLFGREIIFEEFQLMWSWYLIVTDGQTDGETTYCRITALCASIAR